MKRLFVQTGIFLLFIMVVIGVSSIFSRHLLQKYVLNPENFQLPDSVQILIIGDSQIAISLNPNIIPNSNNQAIAAEHYLYTFSRLKRFLENNPQIKTVVLSFNHANLSKKWDRNLFEGREKTYFFSKEFMILGKEEQNLLYATDLLYFRNYLAWRFGFPTKENIPILIGILTNNFSRKDLPYLGVFIGSGPAYNVSNAKQRIEDAIGINETPELADIQMEYLNRIIRLCNSLNVRLVLYASPVSSNFYTLIPDFYKTEYDRISKELSQKVQLFNDVLYALPDTCFSDANHLNGVGSDIISHKFLNELKNLDSNK